MIDEQRKINPELVEPQTPEVTQELESHLPVEAAPAEQVEPIRTEVPAGDVPFQELMQQDQRSAPTPENPAPLVRPTPERLMGVEQRVDRGEASLAELEDAVAAAGFEVDGHQN